MLRFGLIPFFITPKQSRLVAPGALRQFILRGIAGLQEKKAGTPPQGKT
jgi:hypothetical protein